MNQLSIQQIQGNLRDALYAAKLAKAYQFERSKRDPVYFAGIAGLQHPDEWQKEVLQWVISGQKQDLILNCGRQTGKSTIAAHLAVWVAIFIPKSLILLVSPSLRQSSELFRKVRDILEVIKIPLELDEDNMLSCKFSNKSRIVSLPGTERTVRGYSGAKLIIEDESARVADEYYMTIRPMLAVSGGKLIMMSTPFGKRGHFYNDWNAKDDNTLHRIQITADQCPRIPKEFLERERKKVGEWWFNQEYMCIFNEAIDSVFNYETIMAAITSDVKPLFKVEM